jgi:hypothetical protein
LALFSQIESQADVDFYSFAALAGQQLYLDLGGGAFASGNTTTVPLAAITLYTPDKQTVLARVNADASGFAYLAGLGLPVSGQYYLAVTSTGVADPLHPSATSNQIGNYALSLQVGDAAAIAPHLSLSVTSLDFGTVGVGASGQSVLHLSNTGSGDLLIANLSFDSGDFGNFDGPEQQSFSLSPGETLDVAIDARPLTDGIRKGTLTFATNDPGKPQVQVALTVTGQAGNRAPSVSLIYAQDQAVFSGSVKLTAGGVYDPDGTIASVNFYLETNGIAGLQIGAGGDNPIGTAARLWRNLE